MTTSWIRAVALVVLVAWIAGCGGGGGGEASAPLAPAAGPPVIGAAGGTASEASGATVIVPAGAFEADTTIRVAMDSTSAPPLPAGLVPTGNTYVITPHGGEFARPVEVHIPVPAVTLKPNEELRLAKAQPGGEWEVLGDTRLQDGKLVAQVGSFSFFMPVIIVYPLPLSQLEPYRVITSLDCGGQPCSEAVGTVTATFTFTGNGGQVSSSCIQPAVTLKQGTQRPPNLYSPGSSFPSFPLSGGVITTTVDVQTLSSPWYSFVAGLRCYSMLIASTAGTEYIFWKRPPSYPAIGVYRMPAQLDIVEGLPASLDAVLEGPTFERTLQPGGVYAFAPPTSANRAVVDWQRSDDQGASWRLVARSYQDEANPDPLVMRYPWRYWGVRHGFIAAAADQGALIRVLACYTPPDVPPPPCVTSTPTRINVLQQSALPTVVDGPRSVLVKTGQTASFSTTAAGAPSPTLQWQTRAANSTGAWANVSSGTGATTGNYTTPVLSTTDNGTQYRVVASNAMGSAESAAITVSVSDLDVAPTISAQPAGLNVTAGDDAAFAIAARGTEALSYQWSKDGVPINGANSPVLRLVAINAGQAGAYRVTVSNGAGSASSDSAALTVSVGAPPAAAPTIVTQPVSVLVNAGNTATFAVGASGSGTLIYQWLRNGQPIAGATAAFYSIAQAVVGDAATYGVQVSNGVGPGVASFNVVLTVNQSEQPAAVTIGVQPAPQVQPPGGSATFAVAVSGSGPIGYQWLKNGTPIAGATSAVLTLSGVTGADMANYGVTVSNSLGSIDSAAASLTVLGVPAIGNQPANASVSEGSTTTFNVSANGSRLLYQWTRNSVGIAGATSASYSTPVLGMADSGAVYGVIVYNGAGLVFSQGAVLTVTPLVAPSFSTQPTNRGAVEPATATFTAVVGGSPVPKLQWQISTDGGSNWVDIAGATSASYTTAATALADSGKQYRVVATNSAGPVVSAAATLTVTHAPMPTRHTLAAGNQHTCALRADGSLACWGYNSSGQIGNGNRIPAVRPTTVSLPEATIAVAAGYESSCALGSSGTLRCWGDAFASITPVVVGGVNGVDVGGGIKEVTVGRGHACALTVAGNVWCRGSNSDGQLGNGTTGYSESLVQVQGAGGLPLTNVTGLSAIDFHTCATRTNGSVMCWGQDGQAASLIAVEVGNMTSATQVSGDCALLGSNATVLCWSGIAAANPLPVAGLANITRIGFGAPNCAIVSGGTVQCWGYGLMGNGQLSETDVPPVVVFQQAGVGAIATGGSHTCLLRTDAALRCWGSGQFGQLGVGDMAGRTTPTNVPDAVGWAAP